MKNFSIKLMSLFCYLDRKRRFQFYYLFAFMTFGSILEILSVGSIIPFLTALISPDLIIQSAHSYIFLEYFKSLSEEEVKYHITIIFIFITCLNMMIKLISLNLSVKLTYHAGADISALALERILDQNFQYHLNAKTSELLNLVYVKAANLSGSVIMPLISILNAALISIMIVIILFILNFMATIFLILSLTILYFTVYKVSKNLIYNNGYIVARETSIVLKVLQESFGSIRDIILSNRQRVYLREYDQHHRSVRSAAAQNVFWAGSPRHVIEGSMLILLAGAAGFLANDSRNDLVQVIPLVGAFAVGLQRLLPQFQLAYASMAMIRSSQVALSDVLDHLYNLRNERLAIPGGNRKTEFTPLKDSIDFIDVSFSYSSANKATLDNLNLKIFRGERIGVVGESGGGKSTFADLIMGLLQPTSGQILVDGTVLNGDTSKAWHNVISHVAQNFFISDKTIAENVAFGESLSKIDITKVRAACETSQAIDFIERLPGALLYSVGEGGSSLSGGQRQRLAIARAVYREAQVLVLDEATSALDEDSEAQLVYALERLPAHVTLIIITHRTKALTICDRILEVTKNSVVERDPQDYVRNLNA